MTEQRATDGSTPKNFTPPKNRPTRSRNGSYGRTRVFGPVAQWIAVVILLGLAFTVIVILTDGGDFNPFNDDAAQPGVLVVGVAGSGT